MAGDGVGGKRLKSDPGTPLSERYELLEEIGRGGFAVVWKARDRKLGRTVAVKRLLPERLEGKLGQQSLKRFEKEASSIARLNHRNIVTVYDHDRDSEGHYIVMEYVDGGTLKEYLKSRGGKLERGEAVELVRGIAQGLGYAHRNNLIHRDIKPANVLLQQDGEELVPKIVDFGLARVGTESELSMSGFGMGTPWYMPPEQRRNAKGVNHTADIYALGKTLYELISGEVPDNVDPDKVPDQGLLRVILKCIKSKPRERYFSCEEVLKDLEGDTTVPSAQAHGRKGEGVCPSCGELNPDGAKYCGKCGTGMVRPCPECGTENSIYRKYCVSCGTDVEGFLKAEEALGKMKGYLENRKHGRVLKEAELLGENPFEAKEEKGKALLGEISRVWSEASAKQSEKKRHASAARRSYEKGFYEKVIKEIEAYENIAGELPEELRELREKSLLAEVAALKEKLDRELNAGNFDICNEMIKAYESKFGGSPEELRELREKVARGEKSALKDELERELNAGNFSKCHELLRAYRSDFGELPEELRELQEWIILAEVAALKEELDSKFRVHDFIAINKILQVYRSRTGKLPRELRELRETWLLELRKKFEEACAQVVTHKAEEVMEAARSLFGSDFKAEENKWLAELEECRSKLRRRMVKRSLRVLAGLASIAAIFLLIRGGITVIGNIRFNSAISKARTAIEQEDWDGAAQSVDRALSIRESNTDALALWQQVLSGTRQAKLEDLLASARESIERRDWEEAIKAVEQALVLRPGHREATALLNQAKDGPRQESIDRFMKSSREAMEREDWEEAIKVAEQALALRPGHREATAIVDRANFSRFLNQAREFERSKKLPEAYEALYSALALKPNNREALALRSQLPANPPWESPSTGMEFVWIEALNMWVGKYEVTNGEYREKEPGHDSGIYRGHSLNGDRQPVVYVNFDDAKSYAEWMTQRDRDTGQLPEGYRYRLPSEREFMTYCQCGDGREYPWGNNWRPRSGQAGNYADETAKRSFGKFSIISGYNDGHAVTAPVEESWANPWGLYGVGGNVWEACASDVSGGSFGAWRGASWSSSIQGILRCSNRIGYDGSFRNVNYGFRLVLSR